ncbi:CoA-binding domain protein [Peptoclostridium acidaminophilum DSM 3953]|uniref:CoA-binding domain protein n=1 Tax=Peptoclostridium acidaminophilum DSM 3953 TaxID=1286171 RepID=W8U5P9_PEPAC|nr:CoA-binding protein [Peptoclostridium acidaminophilum]AHM56256.1 CoA-binding domain protein [Peptoclostridium acidaminophilum DSM 3953]
MGKIEQNKSKMLGMKKWAVVGVTQDESRFGYKIYKLMKSKGYSVYGVNPKYSEVDGDKVYGSLRDLPESVECVDVIVNPGVALRLLDEISELGIKHVWFQPGSYDDDVIQKAEELGLDIVYDYCVYAEIL